MIAFIQPFSLCGQGGGARILRSLLDCPHPPAFSIAMELPGYGTLPLEELALPIRPHLGKLEHNRFGHWCGLLDGVYRAGFERRLAAVLRQRNTTAIHLVPHSYELLPVANVAQSLGIPLILNLHDDIEYTNRRHPLLGQIKAGMQRAWNYASAVVAISDEIAIEYGNRYGQRAFLTATDGIKTFAPGPLPRPEKSLRIYFMGLFHFAYATNFRALMDALKILRTELPDWQISLVSRSGKFNTEIRPDDLNVSVLPFAGQAEIDADMLSADLLYQPLPFESYAAAFGKFSLSTKLVTYLGSGLPILYHGPSDTAAAQLLEKHHAAVRITTNAPRAIADQLKLATSNRETIVVNALKLAHEQFDLGVIQNQFWGILTIFS